LAAKQKQTMKVRTEHSERTRGSRGPLRLHLVVSAACSPGAGPVLEGCLGLAGYPALRIVALAETGTQGLLGAVIGARRDRNEAPLARRLVPLLTKGMLALADRACDSGGLLSAIAATGAMFPVRGTSTRKPPVLRLLDDGSCLSDPDGRQVRIIEADLNVTGTGGSRIGDRCRLITTLLDHRRYPAAELIRLYHERWVRHEVAWSEWNAQKEDRLMSVT
jgi:hypothetical protein